MPQSREEAADFPQHADCQLPGADLTWAEEQQSQALNRMEHRAVGASFWQPGARLMEKRGREGGKFIQSNNLFVAGQLVPPAAEPAAQSDHICQKIWSFRLQFELNSASSVLGTSCPSKRLRGKPTAETSLLPQQMSVVLRSAATTDEAGRDVCGLPQQQCFVALCERHVALRSTNLDSASHLALQLQS